MIDITTSMWNDNYLPAEGSLLSLRKNISAKKRTLRCRGNNWSGRVARSTAMRLDPVSQHGSRTDRRLFIVRSSQLILYIIELSLGARCAPLHVIPHNERSRRSHGDSQRERAKCNNNPLPR